MEIKSIFVDQIYDFKGLWDMPSKCGLKVVKKESGDVVVFTELYQHNPGSSITDVCSSLAEQICKEFNLNPTNTTFIQHTPDIGSKFEFLEEVFDKVTFSIDGESLVHPDWKKIEKEEVEKLIS